MKPHPLFEWVFTHGYTLLLICVYLHKLHNVCILCTHTQGVKQAHMHSAKHVVDEQENNVLRAPRVFSVVVVYGNDLYQTCVMNNDSCGHNDRWNACNDIFLYSAGNVIMILDSMWHIVQAHMSDYACILDVSELSISQPVLTEPRPLSLPCSSVLSSLV